MKELPQTVFVVDDDDAVRNSLKLLLKSAALHAEAYASAPEHKAAVEKIMAVAEKGRVLDFWTKEKPGESK